MNFYQRHESPRERLVYFVQELERLEEIKKMAADDLKSGFDAAKAEGFDPKTLKVVLKLRKMTPGQRRERKALEAIYMAALGMLDGDDLPDEARRRLDGQPPDRKPTPDANQDASEQDDKPATAPGVPPALEQPPLLPPKDPAEARAEGAQAAEAGLRIYDNPYRAGDPCRAAWDEGWCSQRKSNGMDTPEAYQRRTEKPSKKADDTQPPDTSDSAASNDGDHTPR